MYANMLGNNIQTHRNVLFGYHIVCKPKKTNFVIRNYYRKTYIYCKILVLEFLTFSEAEFEFQKRILFLRNSKAYESQYHCSCFGNDRCYMYLKFPHSADSEIISFRNNQMRPEHEIFKKKCKLVLLKTGLFE